MELTVKDSTDDADSAAVLNIKVTNGGAAGDGLVVIEGQTAVGAGLVAGDASLTVNQGAGTVAIYIKHAATSVLSEHLDFIGYDLVEDDGTDRTRRAHGSTRVKATETRA